ncbi:MAG: HAMP domain-containing protein [Herpetosiphonaceae bacterium]|nr:HAMP domain-containing protein [Herpetosiphonaceae bacterium]
MTMTWRRVPLRYQLALVVGLAITALLATFSGVLYVALRAFLFTQRQQQLQTAMLTATNAVFGPAPPLPHHVVSVPPDAALLRRFRDLADTLTEPRISAIIFAPDGSLLVRGQTTGRGTAAGSKLPPPPPRPLIKQITQVVASDKSPFYTGSGGSQRQRAMLMPLYDQRGNIVAVAQVATSIQASDALLARLVNYLLRGTLVSAVAGMALSALATNQVLRPLSRIVVASDRVAKGDFAIRLNLPPGNEISQLGAAFDEMVAQTAESFAQQQRFVADAAHELRTPLTAIGGSIEMLQLGVVDTEPEKRRRLLASIGNEVDRLGRLVNDLLMLSHLDQQPPTKHEPLDLQPLLLDLLEQAHIVAPQHAFVAQLPDPLPVCGNADQLRQVFLNLLTNASTYTPVGGVITVSGQAATAITIRVADTGIGIPAQELPHVWDRLYRVDRSRSRARGGFGLGLAIVQTIVLAHHGQVAIASTPGAGTTVTVSLPRIAAIPQQADQSSGNPYLRQVVGSDRGGIL